MVTVHSMQLCCIRQCFALYAGKKATLKACFQDGFLPAYYVNGNRLFFVDKMPESLENSGIHTNFLFQIFCAMCTKSTPVFLHSDPLKTEGFTCIMHL